MISFKILRPRFSLYIAIGLLLSSAGHGEDLVLVRQGVGLVPVVLFEGAPPMTRRAADDLIDYIEKSSGVRLELVEGVPDPFPEKAIWVGFQPALETVFPGVDFTLAHPEEILLVSNSDHLAILGRDRWDPDQLRVEFRRRTVDGVQAEYGTVNAVSTFLQDKLGVRWFWPGELGEDVPVHETIAIAPFEYRYHPVIRGRGNIIRLSNIDAYAQSDEWTRLQRMRLDSLVAGGGHPFAGWWDRFGETHPEYFATQPEEARPWPNPRTMKLCKSNPAVWQQWLRDVEDQLEQNPNAVVFGAGANDGGHGGFCVCESCLAWDHPDGEIVRLYWSGHSTQGPAMSDRQVRFANELGRLLKEKYPDRDYLVQMVAYGASRPPPVEAVLGDNVMVSAVFNFHNRYMLGRGQTAANQREQFEGWAAKAHNLYWRPNLGHANQLQRGGLAVATRQVMADMPYVADKGVIGIFFDTLTEHWATQGPYYYILAQLAWDPYADGESIMADYYARCFGPAVDEMTAYWTLVEDAGQSMIFEEVAVEEAWDEDFYRRAYSYLDAALAKTEGVDGKFHDRVRFVRLGLDYNKAFQDAINAMARFRASGDEDKDAEAEARRLWVEVIRPIAASEEFSYAIYDRLVRPGRWPFHNPGHFPEDLHQRW